MHGTKVDGLEVPRGGEVRVVSGAELQFGVSVVRGSGKLSLYSSQHALNGLAVTLSRDIQARHVPNELPVLGLAHSLPKSLRIRAGHGRQGRIQARLY